MTADDVVASLQWAQDFAEVNLYNKNFVSITKVDDLTVEIKTDGPDAMVLSNLCHHATPSFPRSSSTKVMTSTKIPWVLARTSWLSGSAATA